MEIVDIMLYGAYLLVIVAALGAIVLPLINALSNPKSLLKSALGIVIIGVIYLVSWGVSGDEVTARYIKFDITSTSSQVIGGVLITTYLLMGIAVISIVYSEIRKLLN
ncbi:hypothetical protein MATR_17560 [Marivirga tractuosa]|uniref:Uncharacterized protein n=1 Tax=Marivirga tractuosa (strain ATCC 23168 / DSM 4126 / NBRC 15989 / NCIMB 1408 / VKM B-1430 / H-43) TaxID=643867 RepID=E4TQQ8_MARTH|nr:hypothetical protein [Marivirga tractuosa]ADR20619.1 hypothetical protein Ftrac_0617 [Marivirga tractuosa DSM 4126]BDD14931.1 hypothetical protein MATR_17560 [Marivirga tractuosa]